MLHIVARWRRFPGELVCLTHVISESNLPDRRYEGVGGTWKQIDIKNYEEPRWLCAVAESPDKGTLQGFISAVVRDSARVYTDEAREYEGMANAHEAVTHTLQEYVRGQVHVNGIEGVWSMLKRGYHGPYHKMNASTSTATWPSSWSATTSAIWIPPIRWPK